VKDIKTPEVGFYAIANQTYSLYDEKEKYREFKVGDIALVTEVNAPTGGRRPTWQTWGMKVLFDEVTFEVNTRDLQYFVFSPISARLSGKSFCITGTLAHERKTYESFIKLNQGEYKNTLSSRVDYLITNTNTLTNKMKSAKLLGVTVVSESEFFKMCHGA
jgi:NAD-dependent DNA ligase